MKNEFTLVELEELANGYKQLPLIDISKPTYKRLIEFLNHLPKNMLEQLANAKIRFVSELAQERIKEVK